MCIKQTTERKTNSESTWQLKSIKQNRRLIGWSLVHANTKWCSTCAVRTNDNNYCFYMFLTSSLSWRVFLPSTRHSRVRQKKWHRGRFFMTIISRMHAYIYMLNYLILNICNCTMNSQPPQAKHIMNWTHHNRYLFIYFFFGINFVFKIQMKMKRAWSKNDQHQHIHIHE